jgi:hypothetical protein
LHLLLGIVLLDSHVDELLMIFDEVTNIAGDEKEQDEEKNRSI